MISGTTCAAAYARTSFPAARRPFSTSWARIWGATSLTTRCTRRSLASATNPMLAKQIAQDVIQTNGGAAAPMGGGISPQIMQADSIGGMPKKEHSVVSKARQQSNDAAQPDADGVVNTKR